MIITTPTDPTLIVAAYLQNAPEIIAASVVAPLPLPAACALIEMESGGANIYGHDVGGVNSLPVGQTLEVTEANFTDFLTQVMAGATSNGVGPCQITYAGTLVNGKRDGGYFTQMAARGLQPWVPLDNCRFGFELMAANYARWGSWADAGAHYNGGTNPDASAVAYGQRFAALVDEWTTRLAGGTPVPIAPPSPPFIAARWHGGAQTPAKRIVIHGTVSPCEAGGARNIAHFFATETNKTSAHYVVDPGEVIQCVGDHTVAYHAPPNQDSIGVELCDPVTGSAARWNDANHTAMLERAADLVAQLCLAYKVPIVKLSSGQLVAGQHGICGHVDVSNAWHQTTHTDPGAGFPWDRFMTLVKAATDRLTGNDPKKPTPPPTPPEDDMPYTPDQLVALMQKAVASTPVANKDAHGKKVNEGTLAGMVSRQDLVQDRVVDALGQIGTKLDALTTLLQTAIDQGK